MPLRMEDDDVTNLAQTQRLKAAVHFTVGRVCEEESEEKEYEYSKQFIAVLAETTFKYINSMANDLELFAKHAKRNTINPDDVKLLIRKSPKLHDYLKEYGDQVTAELEEKKKNRPKKKSATSKKQTDNSAMNVDESSNMSET